MRSSKPTPELIKRILEKTGYLEHLPEKYKKAETSGLAVHVKPGKNRFDIALEP